MKTMKMKTFATFMLVVLFSLSMYAQPKYGRAICEYLDLTEDQQQKIEALQVPHQKAMLVLRNQLQEKRVHLQTLRTADKVDMTAINKLIDEKGALKIDKMKKAEAHKQAVRKLLTEKQRLFFDTHHNKGGKGYGMMGYGKGRHSMGCNKGMRKGHGSYYGNYQGKQDGSGPRGVMTE